MKVKYSQPQFKSLFCIAERGFSASGISTPDIGDNEETQYDDLK